MAGSFYDGCDNPKKTTPGQLLSYCKKISANTQHLLFDVLHLHFYSTKNNRRKKKEDGKWNSLAKTLLSLVEQVA